MDVFMQDINRIKKASLYFELVPGTNNESGLESYFGGKPYATKEEEILVCPTCENKMDFVCQLYQPVNRTINKKLYTFYYCFNCVSDGNPGEFAMYIYYNPKVDANIMTDYVSAIPRFDFRFYPTYELPSYYYCDEQYPEFIDKLEKKFGERSYDVYHRFQEKLSNSIKYTGSKMKGYPMYVDFDKVPVCTKSGELMEPFLQVESTPDLQWLKSDSCLIVFKSPSYDEFSIQIVNFDNFLLSRLEL